MKLTKAPQLTHRKVLVYGPPKVGKTQLVGDLSKEFNLLWIDLENGYSTLFKLPEAQQERIELVALPDSREYPIGIDTSLKIVKGLPGWIDAETGKWITNEKEKKEGKEYTFVHLNSLDSTWIVVFDSLTQMTNSAISHITRNQPEDYKLQYDDWGRLGVVMDRFLSQIQAAKYHVVCISHETEADLEDGKTKLVPVAGTRNFSRNSAKYFSDVIYCQVANKKHTFTSSTTGALNVIAGSRTDVVTEKMAAPSLIPMFKQPTTSVPETNGQKALGQLATSAAVAKPATSEAASSILANLKNRK